MSISASRYSIFNILYPLLHADRDVLDLRPRVDGEAVQLGDCLDFRLGAPDIDEGTSVRFPSEDDVFGDREIVDQFEMLMDHPDAELRGDVRDR